MGRIVSTFFMSLDGVVETPHTFHFPYFDDEMGALMTSYQERVEAYLIGRRLYEEWAAFWPANRDADDFGPWINALPKHVLSTTLAETTWENSSLVPGEDDDARAAAVAALRDGVDGDVGTTGCATTVRWLLRRGLLDELVLFVDPVLVGSGARLFEDDGEHVALRVLEQRSLPAGAQYLRCAPA